jgi:hypothetical protein
MIFNSSIEITEELECLRDQLCRSYSLKAKEIAATEKTPRKQEIKRARATESDRKALTTRENLPDLLGRDIDTSIDMIIKEHTKELESALDRSFMSNKQQRQLKSITMEDTFDVYDLSTTIYVDMSEQNADMDAIMQQVDFVTGKRLQPPFMSIDDETTWIQNQENMPPPLYEHQAFADLFQSNRRDEKTLRDTDGNVVTYDLNMSASHNEINMSEKARLSTHDHSATGITTENLLEQKGSPDKRRESIDRMDWVNAFLQQEDKDLNATPAGEYPIPELYQESMMDIMPLPQAPIDKGYFFRIKKSFKIRII